MSTPKRYWHVYDVFTYVPWYLLRIIHTLRRCNESSGSMILVHIIVVLQIDVYFFLPLAAVVGRLSAQDRDSCVLALCCGVPLVLLQ